MICDLPVTLILLGLTAPMLSAAPRPAEVIAYVFVKDRVIQSAEIDAKKLTRINYAFANIQDGEVVEGCPHDAENYAVLTGLRKTNKGLQVLASVGGWTWSGNFSNMASTPASRRKFTASAVRFVTKYDLDGIDIDWEYPGLPGLGNPFRAEDMQNYTALMRELRLAFNAAEKTLARRLLTSVAAGASSEFLAHTEMAKVALSVDTVNLMSYDYYEQSTDKITGHHAPLHLNPRDPKLVSAETSVKAYLAAGVPKDRLVLGVPFYGHAWAEVPDANTHGLFQPGKPTQLDAGFKNITEVLLKSGYTRFWDPIADAPYLYNSSARTFVSYEDVESVGLKARYVLQQKLRGIMFWEYHSDDNEALLTAIHNILSGGRN